MTLKKPLHRSRSLSSDVSGAIATPELSSISANHATAWVVSGWIVLYLAIALPLAFLLNIWIDEAYSLNTSGAGIAYAFQQAIRFEEQAPLYFVLLSIWRSLNSSIFFARLFSVICIALTIYLATRISQNLFPSVHPGWVAGLVALNPFSIWAAIEIRMYAMYILFSALLLLLFIEAYWCPFRQSFPPRWIRWLYVGVAIAALYTHYFLAFLLIANGLLLLLLRRYHTLRSYVLDMAIVGLCFVPMAFVVLQQLLKLSDNVALIPESTESPWASAFRESLIAVLRYILPAPVGHPSPRLWQIARLGVMGILVGITLRNLAWMRQSVVGVWGILAGLAIALGVTFFALAAHVYARHNVLLLVPALLLVIATLSLSRTQFHRRGMTLLLSFLLIAYTVTLCISYTPLAKAGDYQRVATYLSAHEAAAQPVLVFNPEVEMTFRHYYSGENSLIALPKPEQFKTYNWQDLVLHSEQEIWQAIAPTQSSHQNSQKLWLLTDSEMLQENPIYQPSYKIINRFVERYYIVLEEQNFYGSNLKLLLRKDAEGEGRSPVG